VKKQFVRVCLFLSAIAGMTGCDDAATDPSGSNGKDKKVFDSSFSDATKLSALSPADATAFCQEMNAWDLARSKEEGVAGCRLQGEVTARAQLASSEAGGSVGGAPATDAELREACRQGYDLCIKGQVTVVQPDCKKPNFTKGTCTATVAEAEACKNELAKLYQEALDDSLECKDITAAKLQTPAEEPSLPGCFAVATKCPGFLEFRVEGETSL
jgi:hypothetical protein